MSDSCFELKETHLCRDCLHLKCMNGSEPICSLVDNIIDKTNCIYYTYNPALMERENLEKLEKIRALELNSYISLNDIFTFKVEIAHNDIDRDNTYFSDSVLETMATQCIGHLTVSPSHTKIRIYDAKVECLNKQTFDLRPYKSLVASCYILRNDSNEWIIDWISRNSKCLDASISCSINSKVVDDIGAIEIDGVDEFIDFAFMYIPSSNEIEIQYDYEDEDDEDDIKPKKKIKKIKKKDLKERIEKLEDRITELEKIVEELNNRSTHS